MPHREAGQHALLGRGAALHQCTLAGFLANRRGRAARRRNSRCSAYRRTPQSRLARWAMEAQCTRCPRRNSFRPGCRDPRYRSSRGARSSPPRHRILRSYRGRLGVQSVASGQWPSHREAQLRTWTVPPLPSPPTPCAAPTDVTTSTEAPPYPGPRNPRRPLAQPGTLAQGPGTGTPPPRRRPLRPREAPRVS